jgi:Lrp/AsnC family leucine-responsive transcriptional regulator
MNSHIVLSTQYEGRPVEPPTSESRTVTRPSGWTKP